jgi:hypothetical protein
MRFAIKVGVELVLVAKCYVAWATGVSLFFEDLVKVGFGVGGMNPLTLVGNVLAVVGLLPLQIEGVDLVGCEVDISELVVAGSITLIDREMTAAAVILEGVVWPRTEVRHVPVLLDADHRPEGESEDRLEDEEGTTKNVSVSSTRERCPHQQTTMCEGEAISKRLLHAFRD